MNSTGAAWFSYLACLRDHLVGFFRGHEIKVKSWDSGAIQTTSPGFQVAAISPGPRIGLHGTVSLGTFPPHGDNARLREFILLSSSYEERNLEIVAMVSHYHSTRGLDTGHSLGIGQSWLPGSNLDSILISTPYPLGPEFEQCRCGEQLTKVLWLLPITARERQYKKEQGLAALEAKFDEIRLAYWDRERTSAV
jgi:hypothetical protein